MKLTNVLALSFLVILVISCKNEKQIKRKEIIKNTIDPNREDFKKSKILKSIIQNFNSLAGNTELTTIFNPENSNYIISFF